MRFFVALLLLCNVSAVRGLEFPGWQGLRVIKAENGAYKMLPIREGRGDAQSLLVVQSRQSRLDLYRYIGKREAATVFANLDNPNFLPMAEDFEKTEVPLTRVPLHAAVFDVEGDGVDEIFLVQGDPRKLLVLKRNEDKWEPIKEWEIATSDLTTGSPVLVRPVKNGLQVLVSFSDGIQVIDYDVEGEVDWLQPRERDIDRNRWWLVDFDEDGELDVLEARNRVNQPVRWYESEGSLLRPAVNVSEEITNTNVARLLRSGDGPKVAFLGANQANTISFYELGLGEESDYAKRNLLPLTQPDAGGWASIKLQGSKAIVELGRNKPLLNVYKYKDGFWSFSNSYPILQNVRSIEAVRDKANTLLFRVEDEGQLFWSRWEGDRFTFPKRLGEASPDSGDWNLLAFDQFDSDTWWVTQRGDSLVLNVWPANKKSPREVVFPGLEGDYESCVWLGGERLLVKKKFSKTTSFCTLVDGKAELMTSRFKGSDIRRIRPSSGSIYLAEGGVVQKLDDDLEVLDQIMLEGDYSISSFAPISDRVAYALENDGEHIHRLKRDKSGIFQTERRSSIPYSLGIKADPVLGLTLIGSNSINVPSPGASEQLVLSSVVDPNESSFRDFERKTLGTLFTVDIDGDEVDELATVDYGRRDIIVYGESEEGYEEIISWKVYDDGKYPYGQEANNRSAANPYRMLSMDIDGDSFQDLVLASHDRILIYLSKDEEE